MKNLLVVGAAGKIGSEVVRNLSQTENFIVCIDIDKLGLQKLHHNSNSNLIKEIELDITDPSQVKNLADSFKNEGISFDGVVIATGIDHKVTSQGPGDSFKKFEDFPDSLWQSDIAVALTGSYLLLKHFSMLFSDQCSIVLIASDLSIIAPNHSLYNIGLKKNVNFKPVSYSVTKAGLVGLVRYLAIYFAPRQIRVNSVSPGAIFDGQSSDFLEAITEMIPLRRLGTFKETSDLVDFLLSNKSYYITGQNIVIDGGRTVW